MEENKLTKTELWETRIQDFHKSGLSRKEWCQEHQISLSTLNYWIRKQTEEPAGSGQEPEPVFVRLPNSQEIYSGLLSGPAPMAIHLPGSVRIEISSECPFELLSFLIHTLKAYA